jgi:hypothetical protein
VGRADDEHLRHEGAATGLAEVDAKIAEFKAFLDATT